MEPTAPNQPQQPAAAENTSTLLPQVSPEQAQQRFERRGEILQKAKAEFRAPEGGPLTPQQERNVAIVLMEKANEILTKVRTDASNGVTPDPEAVDTALIFSGYGRSVLESLREQTKVQSQQPLPSEPATA